MDKETLLKYQRDFKIGNAILNIKDELESSFMELADIFLENVPSICYEIDIDTLSEKEIDELVEELDTDKKFEDIVNNG